MWFFKKNEKSNIEKLEDNFVSYSIDIDYATGVGYRFEIKAITVNSYNYKTYVLKHIMVQDDFNEHNAKESLDTFCGNVLLLLKNIKHSQKIKDGLKYADSIEYINEQDK